MLEWERRIQVQREMAAALDPAVGNEEAAALAAEVGRLKAREAELRQSLTQKQAELQRAVERREVVELRVRAQVSSPYRARGISIAARSANPKPEAVGQYSQGVYRTSVRVLNMSSIILYGLLLVCCLQVMQDQWGHGMAAVTVWPLYANFGDRQKASKHVWLL